jgi:hypothetical protein
MTDTTIAREEVAALRERYAMLLAELREMTREQRRVNVVLNDIEWLLFAVDSLTHALDESLAREKTARDAALEEAARECDECESFHSERLQPLAATDARDAWARAHAKKRAAADLAMCIRRLKSEASR